MKKNISIIYKILIVIIGIYGLYDSCFKPSKIGLLEHFSYYTNLSNLLCIIFFIYYLIKYFTDKNIENSRYYAVSKGSVTLVITITTIVYNFALRPFMYDVDGVMNLHSIGNYIVHIVLPLMVIFDYLVFDIKGKYKKNYPILWLILPFIYWIFICIRAYVGKPFTYMESRYPYFFLDIDMFGLPQVLFNILIIILGVFILGLIYYKVDHLKTWAKSSD